MLKFKEIPYVRPNMSEFKNEVEALKKRFVEASNVEEQLVAFREMDQAQNRFLTLYSLAYIRHTINTKDPFYDQEIEFFNENLPVFEEQKNDFVRLLLSSVFREELEQRIGRHFFNLKELEVKAFSPEIMPELVEENKLTTRYNKLVAAAEVDFEGKKYTLAQLTPFRQSLDRERRKAATEAYFGYYAAHEAELDEIYDSLVKLRQKMAEKLGYENFVQLGYYRMGRTDYGSEDVKAYRDQVYTDLVPLVAELKERQKKRLGLSGMKYYDETLTFTSGNPVPKGDSDWIVANAKRMYNELSPETSEFFNFMLDYDLMDLLAKPGKEAGGYCTDLPDYKAPFIFANFNGTQGDVEVMTHEAGHAFQGYQSRDLEPSEYAVPTMESAEIHSMSMEFLTWPWMNLFFEEDTDKFKFSHLAGSVEFIPYGVAVDEFQHFVYENPDVSPDDRKAAWRRIEKKYQPWLDFDGNDYLERGGKWTRQLHIFNSPFYYIDYTLAQVCAFQFWIKNQEDPAQAWRDYLALCKAGGSKPFTGLLQVGHLLNPFVQGTIAKVVPQIKAYLDSVDDLKL